ncbi:nucleotidyltransferase family protein [Aestuariibacter sp. AA17]|uniref:Nucleotidyltransferase family protein n=1 Tax=Fluctibacter corallii TaxID=2984329 RepID=A0ABT3ACK6_9ALTE|nr:nucleotidyltransferase family protein [Aestuariibacter sp. AA17]MCV2886006.1 nucleotidyltransferase family protein [Aestuariibacter sp. AA17]
MKIAFLADFITGRSHLSEFTDETWSLLLSVLRESKLLAAAYFAYYESDKTSCIPHWVWRHMQSAAKLAERQKKQVLFECTQMSAILEAEGVTPVFLKGAAYALAGTANSQGRFLNDIDVWVKREYLLKAEAALLSAGWKHEEMTEYDDHYYRDLAHELPPFFHPIRGTVLDLHHNLYLPISGKAPDINLYTHASVLCAKGRVFRREAMVLHSVIHLMLNEDVSRGFRDLFDLHLLLSAPDSSELIERTVALAEQDNKLFELGCCFYMLRLFFNTAVPDPFALNLLRGSWQTYLCKHIYPNAVVPDHSALTHGVTKFAKYVVYWRGHILKMPIITFLKHVVVKSCLGIMGLVFGKDSART